MSVPSLSRNTARLPIAALFPPSPLGGEGLVGAHRARLLVPLPPPPRRGGGGGGGGGGEGRKRRGDRRGGARARLPARGQAGSLPPQGKLAACPTRSVR